MRRAFSVFALCAVLAVSAGAAVAANSMEPAPPANAKTYQIGSATGVGPSRTGQHGTITMWAVGQQTRVVLNIVGEPEGAIEPAHIHKGNCTHPGAVVWPLTDVVAGHSNTLVNAPMDKVNVMGDSVNIHKSAAQLNVYMACGNVGTSMGAM
jgi:hypothetical protein